jgi:DNA-binding beta-propeller fold protein YncE
MVVDFGTSEVHLLNAISLEHETTLSVGQPDAKPHEVAISPDHTFAYVSIYGNNGYGRNTKPGHQIAVIDLKLRKVVGMIDVSPYQAPHGLQVDGAGRLYVTCDLSRKLLVIDPVTRRITAAIDTEGTGHWIAVRPDGTKAYVANKNDRKYISVVDLKAKAMTGRIPIESGTEGIVLSPDGKRLIAAGFQVPELFAINTMSDTVVDRITLEGSPERASSIRPRYSPDGSTLLMSHNGDDGVVVILDGANLHAQQKTVKTMLAIRGLAFSADGHTALASGNAGAIASIDVATATVTRTVKAGTILDVLTCY